MMSLQHFIKNRDIELTLTNEEGDVQYIGTASTVKSFKNKDYLKFDTIEIFQNIHPFTVAILHSGRKVFTTFTIAPIRPDFDINSIELVY